MPLGRSNSAIEPVPSAKPRLDEPATVVTGTDTMRRDRAWVLDFEEVKGREI
jgi:hypothetical protein